MGQVEFQNEHTASTGQFLHNRLENITVEQVGSVVHVPLVVYIAETVLSN